MPGRKVEPHEFVKHGYADLLTRGAWRLRLLSLAAVSLVALPLMASACDQHEPRKSDQPADTSHTALQTRSPASALGADTKARNAGERVLPARDTDLPRLPSYKKHAGVDQPRKQHVACGELGFVRVLSKGFEGYRYHDWSITFRSNKREFTHVIAQVGHSFLLVGPDESLLYYLPNTHLQVLARLPALGAFQLWSDVRAREWVWVHYLRDDAVHRFELQGVVEQKQRSASSERTGVPKAALLESVELPDFDGKSVERSANGPFLYTRQGAVTHDRSAANSDVLIVSNFGKSGMAEARATSVTLRANADSRAGDVVVAIEGYPYSMVGSENAVALITHTTNERGRRWQLEVIKGRDAVWRVPLPSPSAGETLEADDALALELGNRSLCLVPGRTWAVIGGPTDVRVVDYRSGETPLVR